jgi:hypothetical protein
MSRREYTNRLSEAAEQGLVTWEAVARACLGAMSEDEVQDMCECDFQEVCPDDDETDEVSCPNCGDAVSDGEEICSCGYNCGC